MIACKFLIICFTGIIDLESDIFLKGWFLEKAIWYWQFLKQQSGQFGNDQLEVMREGGKEEGGMGGWGREECHST